MNSTTQPAAHGSTISPVVPESVPVVSVPLDDSVPPDDSVPLDEVPVPVEVVLEAMPVEVDASVVDVVLGSGAPVEEVLEDAPEVDP
jgi:hypothetical protein